MSKTLERRAKLREDLILAAEKSISGGGLAALKTRELARLDAVLTKAESAGPASPTETLVRIAVAYCDFAAENLELWRALFEHRMTHGKPIPEWAVSDQMNLFRHIFAPLAALLPARSEAELGVTARSLFSA